MAGVQRFATLPRDFVDWPGREENAGRILISDWQSKDLSPRH